MGTPKNLRMFLLTLIAQPHKMITKLIWYPLLEGEVGFHERVYLFYLEIGDGWMQDFNDNLLAHMM